MNTNKTASASNEAEASSIFYKLLTAISAIAPVSMLFGIIAYNSDWSIIEILLISLLGFSGSGQFAALPLSESNSSLFTIIFITTLINSRYFAIALSCSKRIPKSTPLRILASHTLGDEAYAMEQEQDQRKVLIIRFSIFICWIIFGVLGGFIAMLFPNIIPENINIGFPASVVLFFLATSQLRDKLSESNLVTTPKLILCFSICGAIYHTLGKVYFWIPSIIITSIILYNLRNSHGK